MNPADVEVFQIVASLVVSVPALFVVIGRDERRLRGVYLERAWPLASRDAAIFFFTLGALLAPYGCVFLHFVRTRRSLRGVLLALGWSAAFVVLTLGVQLAVAAAVDWLGL